ncbi:unnamed protein product [Caenorhabditis angaria]|uniref:F-box domain-containing protein n=1 Tax=Caenorhabditis angaria TaxID=860376 RepID=A0A9P1MYE7_9PELO|nr:unnamed protein product [Caenorhabditis angaria]
MEPSGSGTVALTDRDPDDKTTFNDLPVRIIELIFEYLETYEIVKMRRVLPAFKDYVDRLPKKKKDLSPRFRTLDYPLTPMKYYQIYEDVQLNWIRPYTVTYESSNVLESSAKFREFLKNVWKFSVFSITKGEKCVENFCKNMEFMENLQDFACYDETLKEEELVKILSSLKTSSDFELTLHQNLPFLTKPIIDEFFNISYGKKTVLYIGTENPRGTQFEGPEDMWRDGLFRFFDYRYEEEEVGDNRKTLNFPNCKRSTAEAIISVLHQKFNYQSIVRKMSGFISLRFGNRILQCKYNLFQ